MLPDIPWVDVLALLLLVAGVGLYLHGRDGLRARVARRAREEALRQGAQHRAPQRTFRHDLSGRGMRLLHWLGSKVPLLSPGQRTETSIKLIAAGFRRPEAVFTVAALSLLSMGVCGFLMAFFAWPSLGNMLALKLLACLFGLYVGNLLPRLVLDRLVVRRQRAISQSLSDALDLLVICTNAGLALNSALQQVADELEHVYPALCDELKYTVNELGISSDIETVLNGLAPRTQLESMRTLVTTLLQSREYGTAITQALRVLARTERTARVMRLEEAAAKLAVKITLPMMLFILPTVLIVAAGPAVLSLIQQFASQ